VFHYFIDNFDGHCMGASDEETIEGFQIFIEPFWDCSFVEWFVVEVLDNDIRESHCLASQLGEEVTFLSVGKDILIYIAVWSDPVLGWLLCHVQVYGRRTELAKLRSMTPLHSEL
jgi:hypothetical protein